MYTRSSHGAHSKIAEMYNRMVASECPDVIEALRKRCEKWQRSSITECTTMPPPLPSSVLVERVNAMLTTMKEEMDVMDSKFSNELKNLKSAHDRAAITETDINLTAVLAIDNKPAAKLNSTNSKVESEVIKSGESDLPKLGSIAEKATVRPPRDKSTVKPASLEKSAIGPVSREKAIPKPAPQDKNNTRPASREKTTTKPVSQEKTTTKPVSQEKTTTKSASQQKTTATAKPASQEKTTAKPASQQKTAIELVAHGKPKSQLKPQPVQHNSPVPIYKSDTPRPKNKSDTLRPVNKSNTPRPVHKSSSPRPVGTSKRTAK